MSDDLVERLRQPWDTDRSIMSQTGRWMTEREDAADRIEELQARAEAAEAKLETARNEALREAIAVARQYLNAEAISMTEDDDELEEMKGRLLAWIPVIRAMMRGDDD